MRLSAAYIAYSGWGPAAPLFADRCVSVDAFFVALLSYYPSFLGVALDTLVHARLQYVARWYWLFRRCSFVYALVTAPLLGSALLTTVIQRTNH